MHAAPVDIPTPRPELSLPRGKTMEHGNQEALTAGPLCGQLSGDLD